MSNTRSSKQDVNTDLMVFIEDIKNQPVLKVSLVVSVLFYDIFIKREIPVDTQQNQLFMICFNCFQESAPSTGFSLQNSSTIAPEAQVFLLPLFYPLVSPSLRPNTFRYYYFLQALQPPIGSVVLTVYYTVCLLFFVYRRRKGSLLARYKWLQEL